MNGPAASKPRGLELVRMSARVCPVCQTAYDLSIHECPNDGSRLFVIGDDPMDRVGQVLDGKLTLTGLIGRGGIGDVYRATQHEQGREVAVKLLHKERTSDPMVGRRFLQEARLSCRLAHPNVITVFEFGQTADQELYLVMELLHGETIGDLIAREGRLAPQRAVSIIAQICDGLHHAHELGLVHRDIKPENLFLTRTGPNQYLAKVLDFGLATGSLTRSDLTRTGMICGTPIYLSPEQAQARPVDARSDIYSLGVVLYEMLCGEPPFSDPTPINVMMMHMREPPPPFRRLCPGLEVPPELERVVIDTLAKRAADRPGTAVELKTRLRESLVSAAVAPPIVPRVAAHAAPTQLGMPAVTAPTAQHPAPTRPRAWRRWATAAAVVTVVIVAVIGGFLATTGGAPEGDAPDEEVPAERAAPAPTPAPKPAPAHTPQPAPARASSPAPQVAAPARTPRRAPEAAAARSPVRALELPPPPQWRQLRVVTRPVGATVSVAGERIGAGPVVVRVPASGEVEVVARRRGYRALRRTVDTGAGEVTLVLRRARARRGPSAPYIVE